MNNYDRYIQKSITKSLYLGKIIIVYGARRVGKTVLCKKIAAQEEIKGKKTKYLNAESFFIKQALSTTNEIALKEYIGSAELVIIDEAQSIEHIGLILKIFVDTYPEIQIIATGSSSFDLSNKIGEPLVGRMRRFTLYPLSVTEILKQHDRFFIDSVFEKILIYGLYPSVFTINQEESKQELEEIVSGYLYKDILSFESIKHSDKLIKLLQLLAFQVGSEVSYNELSNNLAIDNATVKKYINLLEQCFVIFRLSAFDRNLRKEVSKSNKIYFYDLGIRNCLIRNYNQIELRTDIGALWENFCIIERMKHNQQIGRTPNIYFWRNYNGQEVDYIEDYNGDIKGFEFKWSEKAKLKTPKKFLEAYENATILRVDRTNYQEFICKYSAVL